MEITLYIGGMQCQSCAARIEKALAQQQGVKSVRVSYAAGTAQVTCSAAVSAQALCRAVRDIGYEASEKPLGKKPWNTAAGLVSVFCLFYLLNRWGILNRLTPAQTASGAEGYGALFLVGLLTSVHCVAMCGGIGLSQSLSGVQRAKGSWKPTALYNLGRLLSYTAIGAVLGGVGMALEAASVTVSYGLQGAVKLLAGCAMVIMGLNVLQLLPRRAGRMPRFFPKKAVTPFGIGLLNGLMPCGPLQSMQLLALTSGSPLRGGISMLLFALGTMPLMLTFGSVVGLLGRRFTKAVLTAGAVVIAVLGLAMVSQGGSLAGLFTPAQLGSFAALLGMGLLVGNLFRQKTAALPVGLALLAVLAALPLLPDGTSAAQARLEDGYQIVESRLLSGAYPSIQVEAGTPVRWIIHADEEEINGCNDRFFQRELQLEHRFSPGDNTIEFTPASPGTYTYSCWMGMIHGTITVTPKEDV